MSKKKLGDPVTWLLLAALIGGVIFGLYGPVPKDSEYERRVQVRYHGDQAGSK